MKGIEILLLLLPVLLLVGCLGAEKPAAALGGEVSLQASDGQDISGSLLKNSSRGVGVVFLHELGKDRSVWDGYAQGLQADGYDVLAIDLRGHGGSPGNYNKFSESDFQKMPLDAGAASDYLSKNGDSKIYIIGASIGANAGLEYASTIGRGTVDKLILLSPGLDYRGLDVENDSKGFEGKALILASREDAYSEQSSTRLKEILGDKAALWEFENYGHGTQMLSGSGVWGRIVEWLGS